MYKPQFPYLGNQVIISSGRVVHHSSDDFIFLFGKKGVAVSSPATFTVDANEKTIINSAVIQLGNKAEQPVLLGVTTVEQLGYLLDAVKALSDALVNLTAQEPETAIPDLIYTCGLLSDTAKNVKARLATECLSKQTFTN